MNRYRELEEKKDIITNKRYLKYAKYPSINPSADDIYIRTRAGDRLDNLAYRFYKDATLWWIITIANPNVLRRDSFHLKPGLEIRIPSNKNGIIRSFEELNK